MANTIFVNGIDIGVGVDMTCITVSKGYYGNPITVYGLYGSAPVKIASPLNVACPKCKAIIGMKCKAKQIHAKPWGRDKRKPWEYCSEPTPHKERILKGKIQEVCDKLDGV